MSGQIMLTGRSKDSIKLLDGENVAPQPIEDALCCSPLFTNVMLVGQDKRTLGALVCLSTEELERRMQVPCFLSAHHWHVVFRAVLTFWQ
jgi:long-chain acyl-CoA synthetase